MTIFSKVLFYRIHSPNHPQSYIGSTTQPLKRRLSQHKTNKDCSSIHIINSGGNPCIELLECIEECNIELRKTIEQEYIEKYDCINKKNHKK